MDCGHAIGNNAKTCPLGGAPHKKTGLKMLAKICLGVALLGVLASACDSRNDPASIPPTASREPVAAAPTDDCSTQGEREAFIEKLIAQGQWQKVGRVAKLVHVYIMPAFLAETSQEDKQQSFSVISAYSRCEGGESLVVIHDAMSGERIGQFSDVGLELDGLSNRRCVSLYTQNFTVAR
jgi:hypothetical protein